LRTVFRSVLFLAVVSAGAQQAAPPAGFQGDFQRAYAAYRGGQLVQAASVLQMLASKDPHNFDVRELLGLTYAAESRDRDAAEELRAAVQLEPESPSARNNLATSLMRLNQPAAAEAEWHTILANDPRDFLANQNLARLYVQQGKLEAALPLLEAARQIHPDAYETGYELALADEMTGRLAKARMVAEELLHLKERAGAHALLGRIDEREGRYVEAVNEYSSAAHLDPSEENLFAWAGELMEHRAYEPAIAVFKEGTRRYPGSSRLWVGEGMALYARGEYEGSVHALLQAADLNAGDPRVYLFLSKAYLSSPSQAEEVIERFHRYADLKPNDAMAQFHYAISLWKGRRVNTPDVDYATVKKLLERSIALNGESAEAHLQLGILYNDQHQDGPAQLEFERAVALDPKLADAHFRLGRSYLRAGEKDKGQAELETFKTLQAEHQASLDKERAEVQQFVIDTRSAAAMQPDSGAQKRELP
jgi:tetratricopeptide (TPR) repeat protein